MKVVQRHYKQMTAEIREEISRGLASGLRAATIARSIGYSRSALSRELRRHRVDEIGYRAHWAQMRAVDSSRCKGRKRKLKDGPLWDEVCARLKTGLSPEQVSRVLARDFRDNASMQVSHSAASGKSSDLRVATSSRSLLVGSYSAMILMCSPG